MITRDFVVALSEQLNEPAWLRDFRLCALDVFLKLPMPLWRGSASAEFSSIDFEKLVHTASAETTNWHIPEGLGLDSLGGTNDANLAYQSVQRQCDQIGVICLPFKQALQQHPELLREYFGTIIPPTSTGDKFVALNSAVWSGGTFIYLPKGVKMAMPLQIQRKISSGSAGEYQRTLLIVEDGAFVHYVEGCSAPIYTSNALHASVVEAVVKKGGRCRYTTIQNWSHNICNVVAKRALVYKDASMEWVDANIGSRLTVKHPAIALLETGARGEIISFAFAGKEQYQDTGAQIMHCAPRTSSKITSKAISKSGGRANFRAECALEKCAEGSNSRIDCGGLIMDDQSHAEAVPKILDESHGSQIEKSLNVEKINDEQMFYLQSRGLSREDAMMMIASGFLEPLLKELPMEYAVEIKQMLEVECMN